jgi:hypothetical protein
VEWPACLLSERWLAWLMQVSEMASLFLEICLLKIRERWQAWLVEVVKCMASLFVENK